MVKVTIEMDGEVKSIFEGDMAVCQTITNEDDGMRIKAAVVGSGNLETISNALVESVINIAKSAAEDPLEAIAVMIDVRKRLEKGIQDYFTKHEDGIMKVVENTAS